MTWSDSEINEILNSKEFLEIYSSKYKDKKENFCKFLDGIELNTKYFRLTTNNKIGKNIRFKNKNISNDTIIMKEINSYLNKLTDKNFEKINDEIKKRAAKKEYLKQMITENILNKCIIHPTYNEYYIDILLNLYNDINQTIESNTDKIHKALIDKEIDKTQSEYLQFCDKNKHLDLLIGYSLLITELEKKKIINNKISPLLNQLLDIISVNEDIDEKYKCVQNLYNIFKSYYGSSILPQGYIDKIKVLIETEKSMKIKFKLMDILDRK